MRIKFKVVTRRFIALVFTVFIYSLIKPVLKTYADGDDDNSQFYIPFSSPYSQTVSLLPRTSQNVVFFPVLFSLLFLFFGLISYRITRIKEFFAQILDPVVQKVLCQIVPHHKQRLFENRLKEENITHDRPIS